MDSSVRKQDMDMSGVDTDNPTSYLRALFGDNSAWNKEILFPDLEQEYCEVEGSHPDVSYASMVDSQPEVGKTGHVMRTSQSGNDDEDIYNSLNPTYPFTPTEDLKPSGTSTMDQAFVTKHETERQCGDQETMDVYSSQEPMATNIFPLPTTIAPLPTIASLTTDVDLEGIVPSLSDAVGTPGSLTMQLHGNPVQTPHYMVQNPDQLPTSFTDGAEDVQAATDTHVQGAMSHADLADILQWFQGSEPTYQLNPTSGAATPGNILGNPDGNIQQLSEPHTTDSVMEPGSTIVGSTTNPTTNPRTEQAVVMGTPTSSSELSEILNMLSGSRSMFADTDSMSTQTMIESECDLADINVPYQQHTDQSSYLGDIPSPEPEVMSATAAVAHGAPTTASVKEGLKSKIQLKRLQRGDKELMVSFVNKPSGELTEEEMQKIELRKQRNKDSANRSRLNRQMKMKRLMQENAEAEKELEVLKSEVEKSRKVRDVLQHWWDRRLCHVTTGLRKPPYHMGVNDLLDALEKYLASETKD